MPCYMAVLHFDSNPVKEVRVCMLRWLQFFSKNYKIKVLRFVGSLVRKGKVEVQVSAKQRGVQMCFGCCLNIPPKSP